VIIKLAFWFSGNDSILCGGRCIWRLSLTKPVQAVLEENPIDIIPLDKDTLMG
jgi:hypothetical protein